MPSKSRHGRGKHPHRSKKSKALRRQVTAAAAPAAAQVPAAPVTAPVKPSPKAAAAPKVETIQYPYVTGELKRIGILAVIAIVILFILSAIIS
jgi:hypothetical protein